MNRHMIRIVSAVVTSVIAFSVMSMPCIAAGNWADVYISYCQRRGIISGDEKGNLMPNGYLTREQMVKMLMEALSVDIKDAKACTYTDISPDRWSYSYISKYSEFDIGKNEVFNPIENVTRQEFMAMSVKIAGLENYEIQNKDEFMHKFADSHLIDEKYKKLIVIGYETGIVKGSDGFLRGIASLTRGEACTLIYRLIYALKDMETNDTKVQISTDKEDSNNNGIVRPSENEQTTQTEEEIKDTDVNETEEEEKEPEIILNEQYPNILITGESQATLEQAKKWAKKRGAHERFIDIADLYWEYAEITGIRADVLYAQAAKETAYGKYTGQVKPEQNNWAGIKKYGQNGDAPEDHEDFPTPEDGVRGHFNHIGAYIGYEPVGEPHGRYKSVKSLSWAGEVKTVSQLGGKWCPDLNYGNSIIEDYLMPMIETNF